MYTQKKPIDNTHIVRERDRQRNRELLAVLSLGIPIGLFLLLFAWQNLEVIRLGRDATRLQKNLKDAEAEQKALEAELDRRTSFDTVATKARELGFQPTEPKTIVMVNDEFAVRSSQFAGAKPTTASSNASTSANREPRTANSSGGR
jgi:cell division protein FtsB